jgi:predicted phage replisome organizer
MVVKWIKISTDIFNDEKMLLIEVLPDSDVIIVIWFKLLALAGRLNSSGVIIMNEKIHYTDEMLAIIFRRKESQIALALQTFENLGMIETVNNVITIPNWGKHQSFDKLEKRNEYQKNYMRDYREKQKALVHDDCCKPNSKPNGKVNVSDLEVYKEDSKDKEDKEEEKILLEKIVESYNRILGDILPRVVKITKPRKAKLKSRIKDIKTIEEWEMLFSKVKDSSFLCGSSGWKATFDWLLTNEQNYVKVMEGQYSNVGDNLIDKMKEWK